MNQGASWKNRDTMQSRGGNSIALSNRRDNSNNKANNQSSEMFPNPLNYSQGFGVFNAGPLRDDTSIKNSILNDDKFSLFRDGDKNSVSYAPWNMNENVSTRSRKRGKNIAFDDVSKGDGLSALDQVDMNLFRSGVGDINVLPQNLMQNKPNISQDTSNIRYGRDEHQMNAGLFSGNGPQLDESQVSYLRKRKQISSTLD